MRSASTFKESLKASHSRLTFTTALSLSANAANSKTEREKTLKLYKWFFLLFVSFERSEQEHFLNENGCERKNHAETHNKLSIFCHPATTQNSNAVIPCTTELYIKTRESIKLSLCQPVHSSSTPFTRLTSDQLIYQIFASSSVALTTLIAWTASSP